MERRLPPELHREGREVTHTAQQLTQLVDPALVGVTHHHLTLPTRLLIMPMQVEQVRRGLVGLLGLVGVLGIQVNVRLDLAIILPVEPVGMLGLREMQVMPDLVEEEGALVYHLCHPTESQLQTGL